MARIDRDVIVVDRALHEPFVVVVPSRFFVVLRSRPFDTSINGSGTVIAMRWLSGSSPR